MTRERLEEIARSKELTKFFLPEREADELCALARRGLEADEMLTALVHEHNEIRIPLRRACELARELALMISQGEIVTPYHSDIDKRLAAALAAVGMPVEK